MHACCAHTNMNSFERLNCHEMTSNLFNFWLRNHPVLTIKHRCLQSQHLCFVELQTSVFGRNTVQSS
jgi:hypothetical protein